ncbi:MAG: asparagine synthase-related protein [Candidatus Acidiferrales bacterium]
MSVQFGRWNFDGMPPADGLPETIGNVLAPYAPDGIRSHFEEGLTIVYGAFHTTKESRAEIQPHVAPSGQVITWDGRLDNRQDLILQCGKPFLIDTSDVSIVAAAYQRWGTNCFAKLIGDWALSIWDPRERSLIFAKDPIGTRPLYYSVQSDQVSWSTLLDPLVQTAQKPLMLNEEYIAGWFSFFPAPHLSPYLGIDSVSPACSVRLENGNRYIKKYWDFDPAKRTRYRTDAEYEEGFRAVFSAAVQRRLRSDAPVLAELSGGMDSSSIVCMADTLIQRGSAQTSRLDTLSYFHDSEPNWNELPYFQKVEERRGRIGCHIDLGPQQNGRFAFDRARLAPTPASSGNVSDASRQFAACIARHRNRVVLSGTGGDEVTGGVPTPVSELMDALGKARFKELTHGLKVWALEKRKPWFHLLFEALRGFFPPVLVGLPKHMYPPAWIYPAFVARHQDALSGYPSRIKVFGALPSFQENLATLDSLRRQLSCVELSSAPPYEKRYPYLDRDLLEFLFAVPREQLVRPGQRRSLMRRALIGIVPDEILNRKRKAFVGRSPRTAILREWDARIDRGAHMLATSLGIVDAKAFGEAVLNARHGQEVNLVAMMRTMRIESWLENVAAHGIEVPGNSRTGRRTVSEGTMRSYRRGSASSQEV